MTSFVAHGYFENYHFPISYDAKVVSLDGTTMLKDSDPFYAAKIFLLDDAKTFVDLSSSLRLSQRSKGRAVKGMLEPFVPYAFMSFKEVCWTYHVHGG